MNMVKRGFIIRRNYVIKLMGFADSVNQISILLSCDIRVLLFAGKNPILFLSG